jgi:UDP-N-acetylmuramyl pentapeptide phosphotransferase/UDP-N-acetylglucosamine-1-phosphate transferase
MMRLFLFAFLAGAVSATIIALMFRSGRAGPVDLPNNRSLHSVPVPRSGGVGILAGIAAGWTGAMPPSLWLAALCVLAAVSLIDDHRPLSAAVRLAVQLLAALAVVACSAWPATGLVFAALAVLYIVWMINLYNFMDGANGLAGGMALFGFAAYACAATLAGYPDLGLWAACVAGAAAGFLHFNFDPARVFMGDVGSVPLGFLAAVLGLEGIGRGAWPLWFPILVFLPFVADATVTLIKRGLRGEKVWQAHREHYYQRLVRAGWSHRKLALWSYALMLAFSASACVLTALPARLQWVLAMCCALALAGILFVVDRWLQRQPPETP